MKRYLLYELPKRKRVFSKKPLRNMRKVVENMKAWKKNLRRLKGRLKDKELTKKRNITKC